MRTALLLSLILSVTLLTYAIAAPDDAQSSVGSTGQFNGTTSANAIGAQGGNVTENRPVYADTSTTQWQGFWGNISGSLRLGDGSDIFYDWSGMQFQAIFASPGSSPDWTSVADINDTAGKTAKDGDFGFDPGASDSINRTMTGSSCAAGTVLSAAAGVTPLDSGGFPGSWETCIGEDAGGDVDDTVFGTQLILGGADGFNGRTIQYQLMVPVNGTDDQYYFFLEI